MTLYNVSKLHKELTDAGIPIDGCASDGRIDFKPAATQQQRDVDAPAIKAAHNPNTLLPAEQAKLDDMTLAASSNIATFLSNIETRQAQHQSAYDNWATLTAGQKDTAAREAHLTLVRAIEAEIRIIKSLRRLLDERTT